MCIDKDFARFTELVMNIVEKWFSRENQVNYKPFWNETLSSLKNQTSQTHALVE